MDAVIDVTLSNIRLSQKRSIHGRLSVNTTALHLIPQSGMFGAGVGNYALAIRRGGLDTPSMLTVHAFNTALEVTIEQGFVGLAILVVALVELTRILVKRLRTGPGYVLLGGATALLLYSLSQTYVIADQATAVLFALFCATVVNDGDRHA